jgi:hypothetical protein
MGGKADDIALLPQPLQPVEAGGRRQPAAMGELLIGDPAVCLDGSENATDGIVQNRDFKAKSSWTPSL